jgi:tetratricopeptide (TPR) repeat protein
MLSSLRKKVGEDQGRRLLQRRAAAIQGMLGNALGYHRAGQLTEAAQIYQQILRIDPRHADCLHLLGMIAYQMGNPENAVAMIRQAIAINKTDAVYHSNLGTVFEAQGSLDEAADCYRNAIALCPQLAIANYNLANVLQAQDKLDDAAVYYERALALKPDLAEAHYNLGNVFEAQDKLDEAVASYGRALALEPGKYEARHNLGNVLEFQGKPEDAIACYEQVLAVQPAYAKAHYSLGSVLHSLGKLDEAFARYRTALALQPDLAEAAFSQSQAQLLQGQFNPGWHNYEWRWQTKQQTPPMRAYVQPLWTGEKLESGRLLIWGEQGVGDEIMFAGLMPDAIRTGNRCMLDCDARLKPLFARSFPDIDVVSSCVPGDDPGRNPELDVAAHLPSGSLPSLFRTTNAAFAATTSPYLIADPVERERFRHRYSDSHGRRLVGLAWYTNNRKVGRYRSIDLSRLAPLLARPDIRWVSLQYGDHESLENQATAAGASIVIDRSVDQFSDIDLFAAQIAAMDLVVTIDNSTAHLAGALGVPVWLLLPFPSDWRWLQSSEVSPWYPTMRLFRQPTRGDWQSVVQRVQSALTSDDSPRESLAT